MEKTENRRWLPLLLIAAGVLVLIIALASIFVFSGGDEPETKNTSNPDIPFPHVSRVNVATTKSALDSGQAVLVDVRDNIYYEEEHIPGAISIPLTEIESRLGELNQGDWIILYCT